MATRDDRGRGMQTVPLRRWPLPARLQKGACQGGPPVPIARGHPTNDQPPSAALHATTTNTAGEHSGTKYGDAARPEDRLSHKGGIAPSVRT